MPSRPGRLFKWITVALLGGRSWLTALPVVLLRVFHPETSAFMLRGRLEARDAHDARYRTRYEWVDYRRIAPAAALAVMASEDQQFPFHNGFDMKSIRAAEVNNEEGGRVRGASTISQQVAKNLFLWPAKATCARLWRHGHGTARGAVAEGTHPRDLSQHRAVRTRHLWRRGGRTGVFSRPRRALDAE